MAETEEIEDTEDTEGTEDTESTEEPDSETPKEMPSTDVIETKDESEIKGIKIKTIDELRRISMIAQGGDPDAQQTLNKFLTFDDNKERTNLPTRRDVQLMLFADFASKSLYPNRKNNPFEKLSEAAAIAFMAKGGWKSNQFVEMTKQTMSLSDLQTLGGDSQRSILDRIRGRKTE